MILKNPVSEICLKTKSLAHHWEFYAQQHGRGKTMPSIVAIVVMCGSILSICWQRSMFTIYEKYTKLQKKNTRKADNTNSLFNRGKLGDRQGMWSRVDYFLQFSLQRNIISKYNK